MSKILPFLQQLVTADRTPIAAAIIGALTVLAAKFGFHMNGSDVAYLSAGVTGLLGVFVHAHFANASAPAKKSAELALRYEAVLGKHEAMLDAKS